MCVPLLALTTMKLYIYQHCPFCCRVLMLRGLKKLDIPVSIIMEGDAETPTRMVGRKVVPILQKKDGSFMAESMDIVRYLDAETAPPALVAPAHTAVDDWCQRAMRPIFRLCVPRFTRADFAELSTPEARAAFVERETRAFGDLQELIDSTPQLLADLQPLLDELESLVPDPGAPIGESDILLFPLLRSLTIIAGLQTGPRTTVYFEAMRTATGVGDFRELAQ